MDKGRKKKKQKEKENREKEKENGVPSPERIPDTIHGFTVNRVIE